MYVSGIGIFIDRSIDCDRAREKAEKLKSALAPLGRRYSLSKVMGSVAIAYAHAAFVPEALDERQPVFGCRGRFALLFDGRLDNRNELAGRLAIASSQLAEMPDSAVAMHAWERWGPSLPEQLLGEFALIVWDATERKVFAARDHFGLRTLSYHAGPDHIVIASTPKAVIAAAGIPRAVDPQKLADALGDFHDDGGRSFFKDVARIPPAHCLLADRDRVELRRYWSLEYRGHEIRLRNDQDYVDAGRELLDTCVKTRLRARGTIGAELSGGLDSPSVVVTALQFLDRQKKLPVFTNVAEPDWDGGVGSHFYGDEAHYVRKIVDMYPRLEPTFLPGIGLGWDHALDETADATEVISWSPVGNMTVAETFGAARDRGVEVLLCGGGGNATLSWGADGAYAGLLRQGRLLRLFQELHKISPNPYIFARLFMSRAVIPIGPDWLWRLYDRWKNGEREGPPWKPYSLINPDFARQMRIEERAAEFGFNFYGRPPRDTRELRARALTTDLANEMGEHNQGLRARFGIEYRDPLWDKRLAEWCLRIPEEQYLYNGQGRGLIRRIMEGRLPDEIRLNKRRGAIVPDWHRRMTRGLPAMREQLDVLGDDPDVAGILDIPRIRKLIDEWPAEAPVTFGDPSTWLLPRCLPHALAVGRFVRRAKGANL